MLLFFCFVFSGKDHLLQSYLPSLFQHPALLPLTGPHQSCFSSWNHSVKLKTRKRTTTTPLLPQTHIQTSSALSHIVSSGSIRADESLTSFWVRHGCCMVSGESRWWLPFICTSSDLTLLLFPFLCHIGIGGETFFLSLSRDKTQVQNGVGWIPCQFCSGFG